MHLFWKLSYVMQSDYLEQTCPDFSKQGPQQFLWAAHINITISGILKELKYCAFFVVYICIIYKCFNIIPSVTSTSIKRFFNFGNLKQFYFLFHLTPYIQTTLI
jgi:hypothetical protein